MHIGTVLYMQYVNVSLFYFQLTVSPNSQVMNTFIN